MIASESPFPPDESSQFRPLIATSAIDCVPKTTTKLIIRATVDAKSPTTKAIRAATGVFDRGLTYGEAAEAAWEVAKVRLVPSFGNDRDEVFDLADGGHAFGYSGDCSVTLGGERATGGYSGNHTVYVHDVRSVKAGGVCKCEKHSAAKAHNEYLVEDPGTSFKGYLWWSASLLYEFGEERTRDRHGITHGINLLVAPDTEGRPWKAVMAGKVRAQPSTDAKALADLDIGRTYPGGRTEMGGGWKRPDGSLAHGWIHIRYALGAWGWMRGEAGVQA